MNYIFDFDGTLFDSTDYFFEIFNKVFEHLGIPKISVDQYQAARSLTLLSAISELGVEGDDVPRLVSFFKKALADRTGLIKPLPGVAESLPALAKRGSLGILTSNTEQNVRTALDKHELTRWFDFVVGDSSVRSKASDIKRICSDYGFSVESTVYVGDEIRDIESAIGVGMPCVAVASGFNTYKALKRAEPAYAVESFDDLLDLDF